MIITQSMQTIIIRHIMMTTHLIIVEEMEEEIGTTIHPITKTRPIRECMGTHVTITIKKMVTIVAAIDQMLSTDLSDHMVTAGLIITTINLVQEVGRETKVTHIQIMDNMDIGIIKMAQTPNRRVMLILLILIPIGSVGNMYYK